MIYKKIVLFLFLCCVQCDLNLPEGSPCSVDGVDGTCVPLFQCYSVALTTIMRRSDYNYGPGLSELCSYNDNNEPIYCCTDCDLDTKESLNNSVVLPEAQIVQRPKSIAWNKCADYFLNLPFRCRGKVRYGYVDYDKYKSKDRNCHVVSSVQYYFGGGGRDAERDEFPHMALLGYGSNQESAQWLCGGSVISEWFILTAGHCISHPTLGPITYAALGILKRTDLSETGKVYKIKRIIAHPKYKSPSKYHDIALLETEIEINFGRSLLPACLDNPMQGAYTYGGEAPGWGRLGHKKPLADILQVMSLSQYNKTQCAAIFPPHRLLKDGFNETTQMCFGARLFNAITDTCEGDSGGPLQTSNDCLYIVFGVTSYGKDCGIIGSAGMYTRVQHYVPWIESVVWPELYKDYYK